jgi:hypothetical protein
MAARLYASGAAPTKKAACEAVGLMPAYLSILESAGNPTVTSIMSEVDKAINDETVALSRVISLLGRKAVKKMGELIDSGNEHVALRASSDILDRSAETSKTLKATVTSWNLDSADAKMLAKALVEGAKVRDQFLPVAANDFVKVSTDEVSDNGEETTQPQEREPDSLEGDIQGGVVTLKRPDGESERRLSQAESGERKGP